MHGYKLLLDVDDCLHPHSPQFFDCFLNNIYAGCYAAFRACHQLSRIIMAAI